MNRRWARNSLCQTSQLNHPSKSNGPVPPAVKGKEKTDNDKPEKSKKKKKKKMKEPKSEPMVATDSEAEETEER